MFPSMIFELFQIAYTGLFFNNEFRLTLTYNLII